ncbi:hypothetical protein CUMW_122520 [Citrus unshiu]|uniref:Uncharacterized protein n=1 Tax=Citrus unshiu TaxID=55188 RepID=A0A2H5PC02_CITUN|nr:hypothetical protein CUMW_122520 [Citrus unshiu]
MKKILKETKYTTKIQPQRQGVAPTIILEYKGTTIFKKDTILSIAWIDTIIESAVVDPDQSFQYFTRIDTLFNEGVKLPLLKEEPF